jgi:Flp pilus assembly pilin Flp
VKKKGQTTGASPSPRAFLGWLWRECRAQDATEYALLLVLLVLATVAVVPQFACRVLCVFEQIAVSIDKSRSGIPPGQLEKCTRTCT